MIIFLLGMLIGVIAEFVIWTIYELLLDKPIKTHHRFHFYQKVSLFTIPLWGLIAYLFYHPYTIYLNYFIYSAIIGTTCEYILGKTIHKLFGIKLWTYKYAKIGEYSSIYSFTLWGGGGLVFYFLAKFLGI